MDNNSTYQFLRSTIIPQKLGAFTHGRTGFMTPAHGNFTVAMSYIMAGTQLNVEQIRSDLQNMCDNHGFTVWYDMNISPYDEKEQVTVFIPTEFLNDFQGGFTPISPIVWSTTPSS